MVTVDNAATDTAPGPVEAFNFNHAANVLVTMFCSGYPFDTVPVSITIAGQNMTLEKGGSNISLWYIYLTAAGNDPVVVTWNIFSSHWVIAISFLDTVQATPFFEGTTLATGNSNSCQVPVASGMAPRRLVQWGEWSKIITYFIVPPQTGIIGFPAALPPVASYYDYDSAFTLTTNMSRVDTWRTIGTAILDINSGLFWKRKQRDWWFT